jgi:hypothetical protein
VLNSVPLQSVSASAWQYEPQFEQGISTVGVDGNGLIVDWFTACNSSKEDPYSARLLSVALRLVNGRIVSPSSSAGFTLSFKDQAEPHVLRHIDSFISPSQLGPSLWTPEVVQSEIDSLKQTIAELESKLESFQSSQGDKDYCDTYHCRLRGLFLRLKEKINSCIAKIASSIKAPNFLHTQKVTMISYEKKKIEEATSTNITYPAACHCTDGTPSSPPPSYDSYSPPDNAFVDAESPTTFAIVLRFLLAITGLAFIFALIKRCCQSPRKRRDRAARREERYREKQYKCASRKQAWIDWIRGRPRGTPGRRVTDLDEKARLVGMQEERLDAWMEDEIRHLQHREEIQDIRDTRNVVDSLIRAEEGRILPPAYYAPPTLPGPSYLPAGGAGAYIVRANRPSAINIPGRRPGTSDSSASSPSTSSSLPPFSPVSRTTSLPSYRSKPPSYREEMSDRDGLSSQDGFSDCDLTSDEEAHDHASESDGDHDQASRWATESSVPDLSPRVSGETTWTSTTGRTFL